MWNKYVLQDGLLYRANKLCVLASSIHLLFLQEVHGAGLMGHIGVKKTEDVLAAHFFWPKMRHDVECYCDRTTSEMRVRLPRSGSGDSRRSENACKHTYEAFKTIISLTIKLLHFSLKIIRIRSRRFFKR
jgi:hypothetical protein